MDYSIWLQILMELSLSVSGEQDIQALFLKSSRSFHRKLDCTHVALISNRPSVTASPLVSPKWALCDENFKYITYQLCEETLSQEHPICIMSDDHYYYGFHLERYGVLILGMGHEMSYKLLKELKPIMDMFGTNILACMSFQRQIEIESELRQQKTYSEYLAYHDFLTTLPNRRNFLEMLQASLRLNEYGGIILLDLDNFKSINDTLGHSFGDKTLVHIANHLIPLISKDIFIARFGGDEFLFLAKNKNTLEIEDLAQQIMSVFNHSLQIDAHSIEVRFSMGIALYTPATTDGNQLIMNADLALYAVKNNNKNNYQFFHPSLGDSVAHKAHITHLIRTALLEDGFKIVYQPQMNLQTGHIHGYEALLRFKDYPISPSEFIPIAEENETIITIGRIVTQKVIAQLRTWYDKGYELKPISINFSAVQIFDLSYADFLAEQLRLFDIPAQYIEIEITENIFLENKKEPLAFLNKLRAIGVTIAIDDFGTGYSSLNYLTFLPLNKIKLDKSINEKFLALESHQVMNSLIQLAHSLNLQVVAEGIETDYQLSKLKLGQCDFVQGFIYSKPLEIDMVEGTFDFRLPLDLFQSPVMS